MPQVFSVPGNKYIVGIIPGNFYILPARCFQNPFHKFYTVVLMFPGSFRKEFFGIFLKRQNPCYNLFLLRKLSKLFIFTPA